MSSSDAQFQEWFMDQQLLAERCGISLNGTDQDRMEAAWQEAWKQSREAVVVELPEALSAAALDEVEVAEVLLAGQGFSNLAGALGCAYLICKELPTIRSAIEAQGLKVEVKP